MTIPSVSAWALVVPEALEDDVSGRIWTAGCNGITIEELPEAGAVRLVCFFSDASAHEAEVRALALAFSTTATAVTVLNPDWVQRFKETFVAFDAPPFRVVPEWAHENEGPLQIRVDPGRAFGTGTHESTKLCLQALGTVAPTLKPSARTLDLGCGTGILGIAAVKLTSATVVACDHDPLATASTVKHAAMNQVRLDVLQTDGCRGLPEAHFDLVFANLMAPFLISRAAEIASAGSRGCRFILAGLLRDEEEAVKAAWPRDWSVTSSHQGEWASLLYERP